MAAFSHIPIMYFRTCPAEAVRRCHQLEHRLREALMERASVDPGEKIARMRWKLEIVRHANDLRWWRGHLAR